MEDKHIIIFDGVCNFCNASVNFIIKRDKEKVFMFTPMQSEFAQTLIAQHQDSNVDIGTIILIKNNIIYKRSDAALEIVKNLDGLWFLFGIFRIVPVSIRDYFYRTFANNRYRLFGKREVCMVPSSDQQKRFIQK